MWHISDFTKKNTILKHNALSIVLYYLIGEGDPTVKKITFAELHKIVRRYRAALQHVGVTKGDRVVGK